MGVEMSEEWNGNGFNHMVDNIDIYNNLFNRVSWGVGFYYHSGNGDVTNSYQDIDIFHNVVYNPQKYALNFNDIDSRLRMVFYPAVLGWTLLAVWITTLKIRVHVLKDKSLL